MHPNGKDGSDNPQTIVVEGDKDIVPIGDHSTFMRSGIIGVGTPGGWHGMLSMWDLKLGARTAMLQVHVPSDMRPATGFQPAAVFGLLTATVWNYPHTTSRLLFLNRPLQACRKCRSPPAGAT